MGRFLPFAVRSISVAMMATAAHAVTPVSGSMALRVGAFRSAASAMGPISMFDVSTDSWANAPRSLSIAATTTAMDGIGGSWSASGSATSTWNSLTQGGVSFSNYGWTFAIPNTNGDFIGVNLDGHFIPGQINGYDWEYDFRAQGNGTFTFAYNVALASGDGFGLQGWNIGARVGNQSPTGIVLGTFSSPAAVGQASIAFRAGDLVQIYLDGQGDVAVGGGGPGTSYRRTGRMNGTFDWSIAESTPSTVPEPSAWMQLIAGFGIAGTALRGRPRARRLL